MNFVLMFGRHEWALALVDLLGTLIRTRIGTLIRALNFLNTEYSDYTDRTLALVALLETLIRTRIGTLIRTLIFLNTEYSDYTDRTLAR